MLGLGGWSVVGLGFVNGGGSGLKMAERGCILTLWSRFELSLK
jgi:hypothetical protein